MINLIRHRFVRVWQSYFPKSLSDEEHLLVRSFLSGDLLSLYYEQPLCDQRHGLLVYTKAKTLFNTDGSPSDEELFLASCFHDVAKKDCRFNVTERILAALSINLVPKNKRPGLLTSRVRIIRRLGIYAAHADLSWKILEPYTDSEFVRLATCDHHHELERTYPDELIQAVDLFIEADTL